MPEDPQPIIYVPAEKKPRARRRIERIAQVLVIALLIMASMLGVIALWDYLAG